MTFNLGDTVLFSLRKADNTILCDCYIRQNVVLDAGVYYCQIPFSFSYAGNVNWFGFYENDGTVPDVICSWPFVNSNQSKAGTFAFDISLLDSVNFLIILFK